MRTGHRIENFIVQNNVTTLLSATLFLVILCFLGALFTIHDNTLFFIVVIVPPLIGMLIIGIYILYLDVQLTHCKVPHGTKISFLGDAPQVFLTYGDFVVKTPSIHLRTYIGGLEQVIRPWGSTSETLFRNTKLYYTDSTGEVKRAVENVPYSVLLGEKILLNRRFRYRFVDDISLEEEFYVLEDDVEAIIV